MITQKKGDHKMITQKKYDKLKSMLIAQRKKNRLTEAPLDKPQMVAVLKLIMGVHNNWIVLASDHMYDYKQAKSVYQTPDIIKAYTKDLASGSPSIANLKDTEIEQLAGDLGDSDSGPNENPVVQKKYPNLTKEIKSLAAGLAMQI